MQSDLVRAEWLLLYAKACVELLGTEAWKTIDASLLAEEMATMERWVSGKTVTTERRTSGVGEGGQPIYEESRTTRPLSEVEAAELRAGVKVIRFLRGLPAAIGKQSGEHEREITRLRKLLASEQNATPTMSPGLQGFIKDIHTSLGATR